MDPSAAGAGAVTPSMEVRGARASSVIVHRVPLASADRFMEWQRGITRAAEGFAGYLGTEQYPPSGLEHRDWVVVIHFTDAAALQAWLDSAVRAEWTAKLPSEVRDFQMKTLPGGFGAWFARQVDDTGFPPHWKMALAVLLGLYPIVMVLSIFLSPHTQKFGLAVAMLIGNAASVSILEWWGMPVLNYILGPWFRAKSEKGRVVSIVVGFLIVVVLGVMALLFRQVSG